MVGQCGAAWCSVAKGDVTVFLRCSYITGLVSKRVRYNPVITLRPDVFRQHTSVQISWSHDKQTTLWFSLFSNAFCSWCFLVLDTREGSVPISFPHTWSCRGPRGQAGRFDWLRERTTFTWSVFYQFCVWLEMHYKWELQSVMLSELSEISQPENDN